MTAAHLQEELEPVAQGAIVNGEAIIDTVEAEWVPGTAIEPSASDPTGEPQETDWKLERLVAIEEASLEVEELRTEMHKAEGELLTAKSKAKAAKEAFTSAMERVLDIVKGIKADEDRPLLNPREVIDGPPDDSDWRKPLVREKIALTELQYEKLALKGVENMGQLEDLRAGEGLDSIDGFGAVTCQKIEDALLAFLSETRDKAALEGATEEEGPETEEDGE